MIRKVEVVPPDRNWYNLFQAESQQLSAALGDNSIAIYHIGSTSIDTIYAKPIIDMLAEVKDIEKVDPLNTAIEALGYVSMGELGITGHRFFRKNNRVGIRTHHLHVFEVGSPQIDRHLAFRDYMRCHVEAAQIYSQLKQKLAQQYPIDIEKYMDGKAEFIKETDKKAAEWRRAMLR